MTAANLDVLTALRGHIAEFEAGAGDVPTIQSHLQTTMTLLEREASGSGGTGELVRSAEGDLEIIQHATLRAGHRDRALTRLRQLLAELEG